MRSFLFLFLFWWLFLPLDLSAQTVKQDSLLQLVASAKSDTAKARVLLELAWSYERVDWRKEYKYAQKANELLKDYDDEKLMVEAYHVLGDSYMNMEENSDSALVFLGKGLTLAREIGMVDKEADMLMASGSFYHQRGVYDKAFEYYQQTITIAEKEDLQTVLCRCLNNMALILMNKGEEGKALDYYGRALKIAEELDDKLVVSALLSNIGIVYNKNGDYDLALDYYTRSLNVRRINNDKFGEIISICNIGTVYRRKKVYDRALEYQIKGLKQAEEIDYTRGKTICLEGLIFTYFDDGKYKEAIKYAERGLEISEKTSYLDHQMEFKDIIARSYAELGDHVKAYQAQADFVVLRDSFFSMQSIKQVNELEAKYQLDYKETQNQLLLEKQNLQEQTLQKRNVVIVAVLLMFIMMSLVAVNYYYSSIQKQQYNEHLQRAVYNRTSELNQSVKVLKETNKELEEFAFIASHDLKEPLRNMISFNELIQRKVEGELSEEIKDYFAFVNKSGQQMYDLIESTLEFSRVSKAEDVLEATNVNQVIEKVKENLNRLILQNKASIEYEELPTIQSNPDQLYSIFKNLIENGIKYNESENPKVVVSYQNGVNHKFTIKDNGIGISSEFHEKIFQMYKRMHNRSAYPGSGLGLSIVKKVVQRLGGSISLESEIGKGSTFTVQLPLKNKQ